MTPTLAEFIQQAVDVYLTDNVHTQLPGVITKYDSATGKAEVKPSIKKTYYDGRIIDMPVITNVPIIVLGGGNATLNFPIKAGDHALLLFCERSLERWLSNGDGVEAGSSRKFDISDCVAIVKLNPFNVEHKGTADDVVLRYNDAQITINKDGKFAIGNQHHELFSLLAELAGYIEQMTFSSFGAPPDNAGDFTNWIVKINKLKGVKV